MQITDILGQMGGLQSIARELGVNEAQVASGAEALLPAILGGFKKQAQTQPGGIEGLGGLLGQLGGGGLLDNVLSPQPTDVSQGNDVLGEIFGSKDVSRTVAQNAASQTGLDPGLLRKMLPMLAMLVAGFMARQHGQETAAATRRATSADRRQPRWWARRCARWRARRPARRAARRPRTRRRGRRAAERPRGTRLHARHERRRQRARRHHAHGRQGNALAAFCPIRNRARSVYVFGRGCATSGPPEPDELPEDKC